MIKIKLNTQDLGKVSSQIVVFGLYQNEAWPKLLKDLDQKSQGRITRGTKAESFSAEEGSSFLFSAFDAKGPERICLIGLGKPEDCDADHLKSFGALASLKAESLKCKKAIIVHPKTKIDSRSLQHLSSGAYLGLYRFDRHLEKKKPVQIELAIHCEGATPKSAKSDLDFGVLLGEQVSMARDLVNESPGTLTPQGLATEATKLARKKGLKISVLDEKRIAKEKMNLYLAVASGSTKNPPRFIQMSYVPSGKKSTKRKVFLIGKGVTFDSGGLSLKPSEGMMDMKIDMSGSATVIATMGVVAKMKPSFEVHALVAATENMPDGHACRPGDIVQSRSGKTVEILNTDAEGRLTLADAITYAKDHGATEIIELSTLTGACLVALGMETAGVMSEHDGMANKVLASAGDTGELMWRLPLSKIMKQQLKSPVADLKNIGQRFGGAITAGIFLQEFAGDTPYVHIDIAGPAKAEAERAYIRKGGVGFAVHTLVEYLKQ